MPIKTTYTETELRQLMHRFLGDQQDVAIALNWDVEKHSYDQPVEEALLRLSANNIDPTVTLSAINNLKVRAVVRMELWRTVMERTTTKHDAISVAQGSFSSQKGTHERAAELYKRAKEEAEDLGVKTERLVQITII